MTVSDNHGQSARNTVLIALALIALMIGTRMHHFGSLLHLPDASMAVFVLGGLYLRRGWWLAGLLLLAVGIDWISLSMMGNSDFCMTPAYGFLAPAYAVLWAGGAWFARAGALSLARMPQFALMAVVANALSFAISNGSFYWLGGRIAETSLAGYLQGLAQYAPRFMLVSLCWLAAAVAVHLALSAITPRLARNGARARP